MIPLKAQSSRTGRPLVAWAIAALCAGAMVRLTLQPAPDAAAIVMALGVVPSRLLDDPWAPGQLVTLVSSAFLHAGWVHLIGNVLYLVVFSPAVESRLGHLRFLGLYLVCGAVGALGHALLHPGSTAPLLGASGAIAGVLGAHLVLEPRTRITTLVPAVVIVEIAALPAAFVIGLWFVAQLASGLAPVVPGAGGTTAWFAHLGGFAAGALIAAPLAIIDAVRQRGTGRHRRGGGDRTGRRSRKRAA